ncbi:hypothetical protein Tco_1485740, partial [Tanacetum coccineum]
MIHLMYFDKPRPPEKVFFILVSSAAGAARQFGPTTTEADLYGFVDMLDAAPGRRASRELGYGITD